MSARLQLAISAAAVPVCAFIALNRLATGQPGWAALWALVGAMHCWLLVDTVREVLARRPKNKSTEK